jgi:hypothetical protein
MLAASEDETTSRIANRLASNSNEIGPEDRNRLVGNTNENELRDD